jgi:cell division protein FtsB
MPDWLLKPFVAPLAIAVAILSLLGNAYLGVNLWAEKRHSGKLETRVEALAADNGTLRSNNATLKASIKDQNAGVDSIKSTADLQAAAAKLGQAAHEASAAAHDAAAAALDHAKPAGADHCAAASQLIHDTLAGEKAK